MTSNIFHLKIIFYIGKMVSKKFWRSKKSFPSNMRALSSWPPLSCCWENVKKCQNFTYGYFVKNSKNTIINRETVFTKIFEKTRTYRDFDENFQKFAGRLRVKGDFDIVLKFKQHQSFWQKIPRYFTCSKLTLPTNI